MILRNLFPFCALLVLSFGLGACSSVTKGTTQEIYVETIDVEDANCTLTNDKGNWTVSNTPGFATVTRGGGSLRVECQKASYEKAEELISEKFEEMTLGNVLIGGLVGIAVDAASGAAFRYPETISIPMTLLPGHQIPLSPGQVPVANTLVSPSGIQRAAVSPPSNNPELKKLQGNWMGYAGHGCIDVSGRASEVTIKGEIEADNLKIEINTASIQAGKAPPYYAEAKIPSSKTITFLEPYQTIQKLDINMNNSSRWISAVFDNNCEVKLKRSPRTRISKEFDPSNAKIKAQPTPASLTSLQPADLQPAEKISVQQTMPASPTIWRGRSPYGCVYHNTRPAEILADASIKDGKISLGLLLKNVGDMSPEVFNGELPIPPTDLVVFERPFSSVEKAFVSINRQQNSIFIKLTEQCEINLQTVTITAPGTVPPKQTTRSFQQAPAHQEAAPKVPGIQPLNAKALKQMQGYWTGYEGLGCVHTIGSWPASVTVGAHVKDERIKLLFEIRNVFATQSMGDFQGEGIIPATQKMRFEKPIGDANFALINFSKSGQYISVDLDNTCTIRLKKTNRRTIPADFKGKPPEIQKAAL
ncbi:hypothetical protein [Sneathiella aquimaris]|uniref:hypothetical protein n=1 Tax=Sneathiella aquimaris TaxID=2599305 RepID=UPI00146CDD46|nr:hypothetical protein [Sneathiella aquimaris]